MERLECKICKNEAVQKCCGYLFCKGCFIQNKHGNTFICKKCNTTTCTSYEDLPQICRYCFSVAIMVGIRRLADKN